PEVRVCGVAPGPVAVAPGQEERRAAETLLGCVGAPEDVAEAVLFLAGAGFVTGTSLVVDGGRLLQSVPHERALRERDGTGSRSGCPSSRARSETPDGAGRRVQ